MNSGVIVKDAKEREPAGSKPIRRALEGELPIRKPEFPMPEDLPRHWMANNRWQTHMINSFHLIFPEGERFFIRSVKHFAPVIEDDPVLKSQVRGFMGQEVQHGRVHEEFQEILMKQGYNINRFLRFNKKTAYDWLEKWVNRIFGHKFSLSVTVALEHYTATLAQLTFETDYITHAPVEMQKLLKWHACEEIEHKAVAFDVYKRVGGGYFQRIMGFFWASFLLWGYMSIGQWSLVRQEKDKGFWAKLKEMGPFLKHMRQLSGVGRSAFLDYLRPSFHPDDKDNRPLAAAYLAEQGLA